MKQFLFALSATLLLILGCKKDDDDNDEPSNALTVQNVSGNYKWTGYDFRVGSETFHVFDSIPSCAKDDIMNFKSDKTYTWPDSGEKCTGSSDQNGTWDVSGTDKFIMDSDTFNINRWDGKDLEFNVSGTDSLGRPVAITFKFQKQ